MFLLKRFCYLGVRQQLLASVFRPQHAITVGFGSEAEDFVFSDYIAERFCEDHTKVHLNSETLLSIVDKLIGLMKTFDPIEIRNSSVLRRENQREEVLLVS